MSDIDTVSHMVFQFHLINFSRVPKEITELSPETGEERIKRLQKETKRVEHFASEGRVSLKRIPEQIFGVEFFLFGLLAQRRIDVEGEDLVLEFRFISSNNLCEINKGRTTHYALSEDSYQFLKFKDLTHDYIWETSFLSGLTEGALAVKKERNTWHFISRGLCVPEPFPVRHLELVGNKPAISPS
jgi:hypothetical protein